MVSNEIPLDELLKSKKISQQTYDKVVIAKQYIERRYNLKTLKNIEWNKIMDKIDKLNIPAEQKEKLKKDLYEKEKQKYRKKREKQSIRDYESISIIGRGAFGEVHVCREKETGEIVAIKKIRKDVLQQKNQVIHVRNEQQFLSKVKSQWTVDLKASFQEDDFLYLVMEFLPGGDLMNLLIKKDIFTEEEARFYTAELILSIESIHQLDCIHRDIKPDNILIDKTGHIKLSDFGLAKVSEKIFEKNKDNSFNEHSRPTHHKKNYSCVGTAYYVAPEVLNKKGYGPEIDWWSVGVIFFEMLVGYAPFCSKETSEVCMKILNWKKYLKIPDKIVISPEAEDLIRKMINNPNERLGKNGADEIKRHPFFKGIDWKNIRQTKAPFIPELQNDYDVSYFEKFEKKEPFYPPIQKHKKRKDIEYIGYTYKGDKDSNNEEEEFYDIINSLSKNKDNGKNGTEKVSENISTGEVNNSVISNSNSINSANEEHSKKNSTNSGKIPIIKDEKEKEKLSNFCNTISIGSNNSPNATKNKKMQIISIPIKKMKGEGIITTKNIISSARNDKSDKTNVAHNNNNLVKKTVRLSPSPKKPNVLQSLNKQGSGSKINGARTNKSPSVNPKTNLPGKAKK